jgi:hypothetical protein
VSPGRTGGECGTSATYMFEVATVNLVAAVALAGLTGLSTGTGTAAAASRCGDYHFIGAAGSGQRDDATVNRGSTAIVPGVGEGVERRRLTREVSEATQHGPPIVEP